MNHKSSVFSSIEDFFYLRHDVSGCIRVTQLTFAIELNIETMILDRLCQIEDVAKLRIKREQERVLIARSLKALLHQVDLKAEVVPSDNEMQIVRVLQDVKGEELDQNELQVVKEII